MRMKGDNFNRELSFDLLITVILLASQIALLLIPNTDHLQQVEDYVNVTWQLTKVKNIYWFHI
jgi:hypothetical protein